MKGEEKLEVIEAGKGPYYPLFLCVNPDSGEVIELLSVRRKDDGSDEILVDGETTEDGEKIKKALYDWAAMMSPPRSL